MTKKILFITPLPPPVTGQSLACSELFNHLNNDKNKVDVINLSKQSFTSGKSSLKRILEITDILRKILCARTNYDLIYFTPAESKLGSYKDQIIYMLLYARLNKMYIHLHGGAGMKQLLSNKSSMIYNLNRYFLSRVAGIIVLGERLKPIYEGIVGEKSSIYTVENFAQNDLFIKHSELHSKYNANNKLKILFLSNLLPGKGYIELLQSTEHFDEDKVEFHFAGGFENDHSKHYFLQSIESKNNIFYHGVVSGEKKRKLLVESDIFCLPTYYPYEGQPISILEAYAAGCVVITTDHSGIFDVFKPSRNGLEVTKRNSSEVVNAIQYFIDNSRELRKFSIANIVDARKKYRLKNHLDKMSSILIGK